MMDSKTIARELDKLGYDLRKTSNNDARWMVISRSTQFHWDYKDLKGVQRFMVDETSMRRYARLHAEPRV